MAFERIDELEQATHPDPITGEHGAHPLGVGLGTTGGAVAGAAIGSLGGPVGAALGAVAGGIVGGLAGKGVAETFDPTLEDAYWKANYRDRPYVPPEASYEEYGPAYRYGWEARGRYAGKSFDEVEPELAQGWEEQQSRSLLAWEKARHAAQEAWSNAGRSISDRQSYC